MYTKTNTLMIAVDIAPIELSLSPGYVVYCMLGSLIRQFILLVKIIAISGLSQAEPFFIQSKIYSQME